MKKYSKLILSLLGLTMLASCNPQSSSSSVPSSVTPTSSVVPSSVTPSSSKPSSSSSKTSSSKKVEEIWKSDLLQQFNESLGVVPPYVDLGKDSDWLEKEASYYSSDLPGIKVTGTTLADATLLTTIKTIYDAAGWSVTLDTDNLTLHAVNTAGNVSLDVYNDVENDYVVLDFSYDEIYDSSLASAYDDATLEFIYTYDHQHEIPFVYLGKSILNTFYSDYNQRTECIGSKWDDSILIEAAKTYKAAGWTVETLKPTDDDYEYMADQDFIRATKAQDDGCVTTVDIAQCNYSKKPLLYITNKEPYDPSFYPAWDKDAIDNFNLYLDNHASLIPLMYIGSSHPIFEWRDYLRELVITGGDYTETMLSTITKTLKDENWDVKYNSKYEELTAKLICEDGCTLEITLSKDDSDHAVLTLSVKKGWDPSSFTAWPSDLISDLKDSLSLPNGVTLPLVYIGATGDDINTEYYDFYDCYQIHGGSWNEKVLTEGKQTLIDDGFTVTVLTGEDKKGGDDASASLSAIKNIDEYYDLKIEIYEDWTGLIEMDVYKIEKFNPEAASEWTENIKDIFSVTFGLSEENYVPYFYTGAMEPKAEFDDYTDRLIIVGGDFNSQVYDLAKTALTGWTLVTQQAGEDQYTWEENTMIYIFTKEFSDGTLLTVKVGVKDDDKKAQVIISKSEKYDPSKFTGWSTAVKGDFDAYFGSHYLPNVYIGLADPVGAYDSFDRDYTIPGGTWCDDLATNFVNGFKGDNWTVNEDDEEYSDYDISTDYPVYSATKTFDDGWTITVYFGRSNSNDEKALMMVTGHKKMIVNPDITNWDEDVLTSMKSRFDDNTIPFFYMNSDHAKVDTSYLDIDQFIIRGGDWDEDIYTLAKAALNGEAGWTEITYVFYGTTYHMFYKRLSDGKTLWVTVGEDYDHSAMAELKMTDTYVVDSSVSDYTAEVKQDLAKILPSDFTLPFLYIGPDSKIDISYYEGNNDMSLSGPQFDPDMIAQAEKVFAATDGWSEEEYPTEYGLGARFTKELDSGFVYVTLSTGYDGEVYFTISFKHKYVVPTGVTNWDDTTLKAMHDDFNGHDIPYFYIGSKITSYYNEDTYTLELDGQEYDEAVFTEAEKALKAVGYEVTYETDDYLGKMLVATITLEDGCSFKVTVSEGYNEEIDVFVYYTPSDNCTGSASQEVEP